jgi:hypothetical protein
VQEVGQAQWKSALFTTGLGIAAPLAIATLIRYTGGFNPAFSILSLDTVWDYFTSFIIGAFISLVAYIGVAFVASAGWAAGTWALVHEANTGQPADIRAAFQYGLKRAASLWPWAVITGAAYSSAASASSARSTSRSPRRCSDSWPSSSGTPTRWARSFSMTHADFGPSLGKILLCFVPFFLVSLIIGLIFGGIAIALAFGNVGGFGYNLSLGIVWAIGSLVQVVGFSALLIGLLPTYAQAAPHRRRARHRRLSSTRSSAPS